MIYLLKNTYEADMKKIILYSILSTLLAQNAYAEANQNKSMVEDFSITSNPFKPIVLNDNISPASDIMQNIDKNSFQYVDSYSFATSKQNSEKIVNDKDAECINSTNNKEGCLSTRGNRLYQNYKVSSFINGIYDQAKLSNVKIDDNNLFKNLEMNMNTSSNDFHQPPLLSLIDNEDTKSNLLLKLSSLKCTSDDKDPKKYMECLLDTAKNYNDNPFFNIKIKCLVQTSERNTDEKTFSFYLQACINNEMLSDSMVKWISFQSYRLGSVYFENVLNDTINKDETKPK